MKKKEEIQEMNKMARDLSFWKENGDVPFSNAEIYKRLSDEQYVEGIQKLPINEIGEKIRTKFYENG